MFKQIISFCVVCVVLCWGKGMALELPNEFSVTQHWLSFTNTFDIETKQFKLGTVHRKLLSWTVEYEFLDIQDRLQANAKMRFFTFGAIFDVKDAQGQMIGIVNERIFSFFPTFEILSPTGEILAVAKMNFWGTTYTMRDPVSGSEIAVISRSFFRLKDNWKVAITDPTLFDQKKIDPRLFIIVGVFQTDVDYWTRQIEEMQRNKKYSYGFDCILQEIDLNQMALSINKNEEFECYRPALQDQEFNEADIKYVEQFVESYLAQEQIPFIRNEKERIYKGFDALMPLLRGDEFSIEQKGALFFMMDNMFQQVER